MEFLRKPFLILVGLVSIGVEEAEKSIQEAVKSVDEQRRKILPPKLAEKPSHN